MSIPKPDVDFNLLTSTSAMSCKSWSLPAGPKYCVGYVKDKNSPCYYCYAGTGRYKMPNVRGNQLLRYEWWHSTAAPKVVNILSAKINKLRTKYLRVFDSGDFQRVEDVIIWNAIAQKCPEIKFWFSTKAWVKSEFTEALVRLHAEPNVVVRRSALFFDKPADRHRILTTAEVRAIGPGCPKQISGSCNKAKCRKCWDKNVQTVTYALHGSIAKWK